MGGSELVNLVTSARPEDGPDDGPAQPICFQEEVDNTGAYKRYSQPTQSLEPPGQTSEREWQGLAGGAQQEQAAFQ